MARLLLLTFSLEYTICFSISSLYFIAANFVLLPYYTFNYLLSSSSESARSLLAEKSLFVLLVLTHYRKSVAVESVSSDNLGDEKSTTYLTENLSFYENLYCKALENARDTQCKSCFLLVFFSCYSALLILNGWLILCFQLIGLILKEMHTMDHFSDYLLHLCLTPSACMYICLYQCQ